MYDMRTVAYSYCPFDFYYYYLVVRMSSSRTHFLVLISLFTTQAGSWPLGQAAVTSFTIPQEFTQSMQAVSGYLFFAALESRKCFVLA